jgi:hypothetical protein
MRRKIFPILAALCLTVLIGTGSYATTVLRFSLEDLVKRSQFIVVGKVTGERTYWTADRKMILTDHSIEVNESIKGQASRSIVVTTVGGRMGDTELYVAGMPAFQKGEDAVVFVEQTGAYRTVVGLGQGKFTVVNGEVANNVADLSFPDGRPGNPVRMPLTTFRNQIRTIVNRQP